MHRLLPILLLLLPTTGRCAEAAATPAANEIWYQVEVLLFADSRFEQTTEHWAEVEAYYPAEMVMIGESAPVERLPTALWQLADLREYEDLLGPGDGAPGSDAPEQEPDLLFEEYSSSRGGVRPDLPLSDQELITGLTLDLPIIRQESARGDAGEIVDTGEAAIDRDRAVDENGPFGPAPLALDNLFAAEQPGAYRTLDGAQQHLANIRARLLRSRNYRVLYHRAWYQPISQSESAQPILIQGGERFDDLYELDGTITISRSRYLHIDTRLWYTLFDRVLEGAPKLVPSRAPNRGTSQGTGVPEFDVRQLRSADIDLAEEFPELYQYESNRGTHVPRLTVELLQSRRMRSEKLHFIDHPAFGLLIEITPVEQDALAQGAVASLR